MNRIIKSMEDNYLISSLELVEDVFTKYQNTEEGALEGMSGSVEYTFYECLR